MKNCTKLTKTLLQNASNTHTQKEQMMMMMGFLCCILTTTTAAAGRWGAAPNAASRNASCDDVHDGNVNGVVLAHGNADLLPINMEINSKIHFKRNVFIS